MDNKWIRNPRKYAKVSDAKIIELVQKTVE